MSKPTVTVYNTPEPKVATTHAPQCTDEHKWFAMHVWYEREVGVEPEPRVVCVQCGVVREPA